MSYKTLDNRKPILDTWKVKEKLSKHNNIERHHMQEKWQEKKKWSENNYKISQKTYNKMAIHTYISIVTLNVNGVNPPIKRHSVTESIRNQDPRICFQKVITSNLKIHRD